MSVSREEINLIVQEVLKKIGPSQSIANKPSASQGIGIFNSVDEAVAAATAAQKQLVELPCKNQSRNYHKYAKKGYGKG